MVADTNILDIVPTRAQLFKQSNVHEFKATVFESRKPKPKNDGKHWVYEEPKKAIVSDDDLDDDIFGGNNRRRKPKRPKRDDTEFDIKKARNEVVQLALSSGFKKEKNKKKAEVALLVKLGAKPPKRKYRNYKEMLEDKARAKKQQTEIAKLKQLGKNKNGAALVKCRNKHKSKKQIAGGIAQHYGIVNPKLKKKKL